MNTEFDGDGTGCLFVIAGAIIGLVVIILA